MRAFQCDLCFKFYTGTAAGQVIITRFTLSHEIQTIDQEYSRAFEVCQECLAKIEIPLGIRQEEPACDG